MDSLKQPPARERERGNILIMHDIVTTMLLSLCLSYSASGQSVTLEINLSHIPQLKTGQKAEK